MPSFIEKLLFLIAFFLIVFFLVIYIQPGSHWVNNRDALRAQDIQEIAHDLDYEATTASFSARLVKGVPTDMHQIGEADTGCSLETSVCHITQDSCLNLDPVMPIGLTFPSDPKNGSIDRTKYAVSRTADDEVTIVACNGETGQKLQIVKKFAEVKEFEAQEKFKDHHVQK